MVDISINIEVIRLNVNGLNIPVKRLRLSEREKNQSSELLQNELIHITEIKLMERFSFKCLNM